MTHRPSSQSPNPIEPWQLTAYALNELEPSDANRVKQALKTDASLRTEFKQIQQTLSAVRTALSESSTSVKLSENQSAVVANQIEQLAATKASSQTPSVKLAARPFYRRKRFAAILATAAAIPLALTWLPTFNEDASPIALSVPNQSQPSPSNLSDDVRLSPSASESVPLSKEVNGNELASIVASTDAISAGSGLIGEVDISFVPEMGLVTINGSKRDVERAQTVIDELKEGKPIQPSSGPTSSTESKDPFGAVSPSDPASVASVVRSDGEVAIELSQAGGASDLARRSLKTKNETLGEKVRELHEQASDKYSEAELDVSDGIPSRGINLARNAKEEFHAIQPPGQHTGGYPGGMGMSGGMPGGYGGGPVGGGAVDEGMPIGGDGRYLTNMVTPMFADDVFGKNAGTNESLAKRLKEQLPAELRQNAPHLFNTPAIERTNTDRFERIVETPFVETQKAPLSTFSIDVDTASYSKIRQTLMEGNRLPSPSMVRIEEMLNYFEYEYAGPQDDRPFAAHMNIDRCPWNSEHQLVRIGLQAKKLDSQKRVKANIVFLLDVSGSMAEPNKLPLVKKALSMMVNQLTENDRVAIVVYAGAAGCVLPSTCGIEKHKILSSLDHLHAGGSTNGGQGIQLAYSIAKEHFIAGGANRVILCTDGDFNVGVTGDDALVAMMQENAKSNIFLTCLGFGAGNYNDTMMEKISNKGNGIYGMIDNELEARRMMVEQLGGTLVTVAKDVKIQVDFNPAKVAGYRLIGYEDRRLANKDFDNDQKDAGEIGAGHRVTALYEVIPIGKSFGVNPQSGSESSKYLLKPKAVTRAETPVAEEFSSEVLTLKVRYKEPEGSVSTKQEFVLNDTDLRDRLLNDRDMQWATSVAEFGLLLRRSQMAPQADWSDMLERAAGSAGGDAYRLECLAMMRKAKSMFP